MNNQNLCGSLGQLNNMNVLGDMIVNIDTNNSICNPPIPTFIESETPYSKSINYYVGHETNLTEETTPELIINNKTTPVSVKKDLASPAFSFEIDGENIPYGTYLVCGYLFILPQQLVPSGTQYLFTISAETSPTSASMSNRFNLVSVQDNTVVYSIYYQTVININQYSVNKYVVGSVWTNSENNQETLFDSRTNVSLVRIA